MKVTYSAINAIAEKRGYQVEFNVWRKLFTLKNKANPDLFCWLYDPHHAGKLIGKARALNLQEWEQVINEAIDIIEQEKSGR